MQNIKWLFWQWVSNKKTYFYGIPSFDFLTLFLTWISTMLTSSPMIYFVTANGILNYHTCLNSNVVDTFIWSGRRDGKYTTQAGYRWLLRSQYDVQNFDQHESWLWIWKLPAPEKVQLMCWLVCQAADPTASLLHHRGMLQSPICSRCRFGLESILHCLRDCDLPKKVWTELGFHDVAFFSNTDPRSWIRQGIMGDKVYIFLATNWWLWHARNMACIGGESIHCFQVKIYIQTFAQLPAKLFPVNSSSIGPSRLVTWHARGDSNVVLNVDSSSIGNPSPSGFGGIIRRSNGDWLHGFAGHLGCTNSLHAELCVVAWA